MFRVLNFAVGVSLFFAGGSAAAAPAKRMRIIQVLDTAYSGKRGDVLDEECKFAGDMWDMYFGGFEELNVPITNLKIDGDNASATNVRAELNALKLEPGDSIIFYYCGHGGIDRRTREQAFLLGNRVSDDEKDIRRDELRRMLLAKKPQALFMFTEMCSNEVKLDSGVKLPGIETSSWKDLFVDFEGVVDITAASPGSKAWFSSEGGFFTNALVSTLLNPHETLDADANGKVTWSEAFEALKERQKMDFLAIQNGVGPRTAFGREKPQVPHHYYLGGWPR